MERQINTSHSFFDLLLICFGVSGRDTGRLKVHKGHYIAAIPALWEEQSDSSPCSTLEFTLKDCSKLITSVALLHRNLTAFYRFLLDLS